MNDVNNTKKYPLNKKILFEKLNKEENWECLLHEKLKYHISQRRKLKCKFKNMSDIKLADKCHHNNYIDNRTNNSKIKLRNLLNRYPDTNKHLRKTKINVINNYTRLSDNNCDKLKQFKLLLLSLNNDEIEEIVDDPIYYLKDYKSIISKAKNYSVNYWKYFLKNDNVKVKKISEKAYINLNKQYKKVNNYDNSANNKSNFINNKINKLKDKREIYLEKNIKNKENLILKQSEILKIKNMKYNSLANIRKKTYVNDKFNKIKEGIFFKKINNKILNKLNIINNK